ncbi:16S rRNA (uracil(1498)-N(3))-methyltransferase [uncultured Jatrophihabitans sp.]|uniref:16S rRNA (uracil(1498)-N(3))-methyltransferase n=1 Tax=uncultured Jatrophihabitans sp. TaxID=1610747 RepID=UPI0035CB9DCD
MTPPLFLLDDVPDASTLRLGGDEGRHAARVKRIAVGETVLIGDGRGCIAQCAVTAVDGDGLQLRVAARSQTPRADPRVVVVQALPKGERAELAVEMLTELGVDEIVPWQSARSIVRWDGTRGERSLERWRRTAREATKQSRRAWLPEVGAVAATPDVAARLRAAACAFVLHEGATVPLAQAPVADTGEVVVVVGPEGGVAPDELAAFEGAGATAVRLGAQVLRTSTAGPAAIAALSVRLGRWG